MLNGRQAHCLRYVHHVEAGGNDGQRGGVLIVPIGKHELALWLGVLHLSKRVQHHPMRRYRFVVGDA